MTYKTILLPQPSKTNKQVREYLDAFSKGGRLVMPNRKGWRVIGPDGQKSSPFASKQVAIAKARDELAGTDSKVFIFDKAGQLINTISD